MLAAVAVTAVSACGNYSNEDLDFQLALPEQNDIEVKMQMVSRTDSAEYYEATRTTVITFNAMVLNMVSLIEVVRGYTPTERHGNQRIWGPFASDKYADWQMRVLMERAVVSESLLKMNYYVQVRQVGQDDAAWVSFLEGTYTSQGSARTGTGAIHFLAQQARAASYPVDDDPGLRELDRIDVAYNNAAYPVGVSMAITNLPAASTQAGTYSYLQELDGSGTMTFDWQGRNEANSVVTATMKSRWLGSGAGRGDLVLDPGGLAFTLGTDCWGADATPTYSFRVRDEATNRPRNEGSADSCLF